MKAQRPKKKESERKKKSQKEEDLNFGHKRVLHPLGSRSFERKLENPKNDEGDLKDAKKDVDDLEGSLETSHSHVSLKEVKEGKSSWISCQTQVSGRQRSERDKWWPQGQNLAKEPRDLNQGKGHVVRERMVIGFPSSPIARRNLCHFWEKDQTKKSQHQGSRIFEMSF